MSLIFKGAIKSFGQGNIKVSILLDNALQHCPRGCNFIYFLLKKLIHYWDGDVAGIPKLAGDRDG